MRPEDPIQSRLVKTRIAPDLLDEIERRRTTGRSRKKAAADAPAKDKGFDVVIEFNRSFPGGVNAARQLLLAAYLQGHESAANEVLPQVMAALHALPPDDTAELGTEFAADDTLQIRNSLWTDTYVFGHLAMDTVNRLSNFQFPLKAPAAPGALPAEGPTPGGAGAEAASAKAPPSVALIYKIWLNHEIKRCVYESVRTVKCDAATASFAATGEGIVWAVADTGIDATHPHFKSLATTVLPSGLSHQDFTKTHPTDAESSAAALVDTAGHGSHVAGIIAGMTCPKDHIAEVTAKVERIMITSDVRESDDTTKPVEEEFKGIIRGMAPHCKLLSLKVLEGSQTGQLSSLLAAIGYVQKSNDNGRSLKIHGLNLSLGYAFDPEWFAAGQSPLCVEVDRLVRAGVCVVVAAGNGGYGTVDTYSGGAERAAHMGTIADPGNSALAITVGSTHRDMPHSYGISYFSGKGPTSDGRMKPDLVAPGERIVSCALMDAQSRTDNVALFKVDSGTSMATPHVSGAIAAFLSVRSEFKGQPEVVKDIFVQAATDLKRRTEFQGAGLLDLMRALQAV